MFNFPNMQDAIIASQNEAQDMLFKFYDNRNKNRLRKLLTRAMDTDEKTARLVQDTNGLITQLTTIE